eukprot:12190514-Karenia_brevis.AAC.1
MGVGGFFNVFDTTCRVSGLCIDEFFLGYYGVGLDRKRFPKCKANPKAMVWSTKKMQAFKRET